jgi:type II secretory ATPase GspE/PulE/Tfp pilus assembly ATPase PilB-like protein
VHGLESRTLFRGRGCERCNDTGFSGRIGLFEFWISDKEIEEMIAKKAEVSAIRDYQISQGMRTLVDDGLDKALAGTTTLSEIERAVIV